ncbi:MAG: sigma-E factor negative regulatory protein [Steroidobacteraceae bacterium]
MTDRIREQISAFLDGELPADEVSLLVRRLERDPALRRTFGRYVLAGEVMRAPGGQIAGAGFSARVSAAIDAEAGAPEVAAAGPRPSRWGRPAIATAVAASTAIAAVLLVGRSSEQATTLAEITIERARMAVPTVQIGNAATGHSQRLAGYLVAHSQFASTLGRRNAWSSVLASDPGLARSAIDNLEAP